MSQSHSGTPTTCSLGRAHAAVMASPQDKRGTWGLGLLLVPGVTGGLGGWFQHIRGWGLGRGGQHSPWGRSQSLILGTPPTVVSAGLRTGDICASAPLPGLHLGRGCLHRGPGPGRVVGRGVAWPAQHFLGRDLGVF